MNKAINALALVLEPVMKEYCSDTFDAEASELRDDEARKLAVFFASRTLRGGDIGNEKFEPYEVFDTTCKGDGLQISEVLEWIREEPEKYPIRLQASSIERVKIHQMESTRWNSGGRKVPNQFVISTDEGEYFQSYDSIIVFRSNDGSTYLDEKTWDYSTTTGKYRNEYLGDDGIVDTRKKIKDGTYKLVNLN